VGALALLGAVGLMGVPLAWGGPLDVRMVDGEAQWLIHVDVEAALKTAVGRSVLADHRSPAADALESLRWRMGVSAVNDVRGVTVFGRSECGDPGTILVDMTGAADGLNTSIPAANLPGYERAEISPGGAPLHSWNAEGERVYAMVAPGSAEVPEGRLLILAPSRERVERVLEVRSGTRASAAMGTNLPNLTPDAQAIVFVSAIDLDAFQPSAALSQKVRGLTINIGERASPAGIMAQPAITAATSQDSLGKGATSVPAASGVVPSPDVEGPWFYATARLTTADASAASKASTLIRGVVGVLMQATESDPRAQHLRAGLSRIRVETLGESVHVTMTEPVAEITTAIREGRAWLPEADQDRAPRTGRATPGGGSPNTLPGKSEGPETADRAERRP
jgi:hypothetical protein